MIGYTKTRQLFLVFILFYFCFCFLFFFVFFFFFFFLKRIYTARSYALNGQTI